MSWRQRVPFHAHLRWLVRLPDYVGIAGGDWPRLMVASAPGHRVGCRVRIRNLGGQPIVVRAGTTDAEVAWSAFRLETHLPMRTSPSRIWDVGANVGFTAADLAHRYPHARVVAVEPDAGNVAAARENTASFENVSLIEAAAWTSSGPISFETDRGRESGGRIRDHGTATVEAISLDDLAQKTFFPEFVKLDVEGAEKALLQTGPHGWLRDVAELRVECHGAYTPDMCKADLERLGLAAELRPERFARSSVLGYR